jgi:fumarylacetoacetase
LLERFQESGIAGVSHAAIDETHDPDLRSWVDGATGHPDFPVQNLPLGVFSWKGDTPRGGVAIGDHILDLSGLATAGLLHGAALEAARAASGTTLNKLLALGAAPRRALRLALSRLLREGADRDAVTPWLHASAECCLHLPASIGDYTDFYAGIHHAANVGKLFRPDNPLLPNYKYVPIGYHGRASSVRVSGAPVRRPSGQIKSRDAETPVFGPTCRLDYELELGLWIGPGNELGEPILIGAASDHLAGLCLLNDWSARDVQAWEYQPLGPFLAKNFATTISPWIVTAEALAPFRIAQAPRPDNDPAPLPYLWDDADQRAGAFAIALQVFLRTARMRRDNAAPFRLSIGQAGHLYWTAAQLIAHHASNGCNLSPGDLLGTGTISAPHPGGFGSLLEITSGGRDRIALPNGETRGFLEDGDEITFAAHARADGFAPIGFGMCSGIISPARVA